VRQITQVHLLPRPPPIRTPPPTRAPERQVEQVFVPGRAAAIRRRSMTSSVAVDFVFGSGGVVPGGRCATAENREKSPRRESSSGVPQQRRVETREMSP
jgi:hypothetical protein